MYLPPWMQAVNLVSRNLQRKSRELFNKTAGDEIATFQSIVAFILLFCCIYEINYFHILLLSCSNYLSGWILHLKHMTSFSTMMHCCTLNSTAVYKGGQSQFQYLFPLLHSVNTFTYTATFREQECQKVPERIRCWRWSHSTDSCYAVKRLSNPCSFIANASLKALNSHLILGKFHISIHHFI